MNRASQIAAEATRLCTSPSDYLTGTEGQPSRYAKTLELLAQDGRGECLQSIQNDKCLSLLAMGLDGDSIVRSAFRFTDKSVAVIFDGGIEIAQDSESLKRTADGIIVGAFDGWTDSSMKFAVAMQQSAPPTAGSDEWDEGDPSDQEMAQGRPQAAGESALSGHFKIVSVDAHGNTMIRADDLITLVPPGAEANLAVLAHIERQSESISTRLGIPLDVIRAETAREVSLVQQVASIFAEVEASLKAAPREEVSESFY